MLSPTDNTLTFFHVRLIVKVGHLPAILLIVVVMRVRAVMRRRYALGIWRRMCTIVEVHLRAGLIDGWRQHLLRILALVGAHTNHPHQQHNEYDKDDRRRNAAGNVREFGAFGAYRSRKRAGASARRCTLQILDAKTGIVTIVFADVRAMDAGAIEAGLAFALEIGRLWYENTVSVRITVRRRRFTAVR